MPSLDTHITAIDVMQKYHIEHHKHLGEDGIDTDLPSRLELFCLNNVLGKTFFA
jgi:sphingolipid delta-4 desaturase